MAKGHYVNAEALTDQPWFVAYHPYNEDGSPRPVSYIVEETVAQCKRIVLSAPEAITRCPECLSAKQQNGKWYCCLDKDHPRRVYPASFCSFGYVGYEDEKDDEEPDTVSSDPYADRFESGGFSDEL